MERVNARVRLLDGRRGVTLIEILTALFVIVMAGSGILGAMLSSQQLSEHAGHTMKAVSDGDDLMERIRATSFETLQATFPAGLADGGGVTDYAALVGGYTLPGEQIVVTYPSQTASRIEILVTVNWTERGRARSTVLSTVRTRG